VGTAERAKDHILEVAKSYQIDLSQEEVKTIFSITTLTTHLIGLNGFEKNDLLGRVCLSMVMSTLLNVMRLVKEDEG